MRDRRSLCDTTPARLCVSSCARLARTQWTGNWTLAISCRADESVPFFSFFFFQAISARRVDFRDVLLREGGGVLVKTVKLSYLRAACAVLDVGPITEKSNLKSYFFSSLLLHCSECCMYWLQYIYIYISVAHLSQLQSTLTISSCLFAKTLLCSLHDGCVRHYLITSQWNSINYTIPNISNSPKRRRVIAFPRRGALSRRTFSWRISRFHQELDEAGRV